MINMYHPSHSGHLPVRVLQHNIISAFEKVHPDYPSIAQKVIDEQGLDPEIGYTINKDSQNGNKIIGPHVKNSERRIYLDETFLSYLWCVCYFLYVESNKLVNEDFSYSKETNDLFDYAIKLNSNYVDWDKSKLVNPEEYTKDNKDNVENTNAIFERAIAFILCHEFYHIECGHIDSDIYANREKSLEIVKEKLENECEADKKAVCLMFEGSDQKNEDVVKYGITISLCALLFLKSKLGGTSHPDSDNRIRNALDCLELDENDTCWLVACASLNIWQNFYGLNNCWEDRGSFKDTFLDAARQFD